MRNGAPGGLRRIVLQTLRGRTWQRPSVQ